MLCMRWMLVSLLKMNERAGGLDQPFEIIGIGRFRLEPELLENVVCFVITLLVPAMEKGAVKRVACNVSLVRVHSVAAELGQQL